jgi:hypothetical protein
LQYLDVRDGVLQLWLDHIFQCIDSSVGHLHIMKVK